MALDKDSFQLIMKLLNSQPWLNSKSEELQSILFGDCPCDRSRQLVCEILTRFLYVDREMYGRMISQLSEDIVTEPYLVDEVTQIVAMAADSNADSSLEVLYNLKDKLEREGWRRHRTSVRYTGYMRNYTRYGCKNIIIVDDFIGSGRTALGRVETIRREFAGQNITDYKVFVKVLVAAEVGVKYLRDNGVDVAAQQVIKKGIDDYYDLADAAVRRGLMVAAEEKLSKEYNGRQMPSLGYGGVQAAYCRESSNTPNSVFPIFWWPFYFNGEERKRLLIRAMADV